MEDRSSPQSILINLRDAAVDFSKPYQPPASVPSIRAALVDLLRQLGIADPGAAVMSRLEQAVKRWGDLGKELSNLNLDFVEPIKTLDDLTGKAGEVKGIIDEILTTPAQIWGTLGAAGAAIAEVFPKRLLDYILYEALTKSHPKIGGVFLLFAVLRREPTPPTGPAFVFAEIRVFDLAQLIEVVTHPREAIQKALKWGTDQFNARPIVDGLALLGSLAGGVAGPDDATFDLLKEKVFVPGLAGGLAPSASRTLSKGATTIEFLGLHHAGVGVLVANPVDLTGGVNSLHPPQLRVDVVLALAPGPGGPAGPPVVKLLP